VDHLRYAATKGRETKSYYRFFSYRIFLMLIASVTFILVFLFPGQSMINTLVNQGYISDVDFRYSLLFLAQSGSSSIKYTDIKKNPLQVIHKLEQALTQFKQTKNLNNLWLNYIVLKVMAFDITLPKAATQQANAVMNSYFANFKTLDNSEQQLKQLAEDALAINQSSDALYFYEQILARNSEQPLYFYSRVAQVALWAKQCERSSELYFIAQHKALAISDKRYLYFTALQILVQCDKAPLAMYMAQQNIDGLNNDLQTYQMLVDIAIKANQVKIAQQYMLKLLELKTLNDSQ